MGYDLHIHSDKSDGIMTPEQVVDSALAAQLDAFALTDHDTLEGVQQAMHYAEGKGIYCLAGIEISTFAGEELHILGYNPDCNNPDLLYSISRLQALRKERNYEIVRKLHAHGVRVTVCNELEGNAKGRSHIANLLVEQGFVRTRAEAFDKYIGKGAPCYTESMRILPEEAVRMIRSAGGLAVLAHPYRYLQKGSINGYIERLVEYGLGGIEVYYPNYGAMVRADLIGLAHHYGLICTGGSDHHSDTYGAAIGSVDVRLSPDALAALKIPAGNGV